MIGLVNIGNTCFINVCLQILFCTEELNVILDEVKKVNTVVDSKIFVQWMFLKKKMENGKERQPITPTMFINSIHQLAKMKKMDIFTQYTQHDFTEFLSFLIDCLHNSIKREVTMNISGTPQSKKDEIARLCYETFGKMYSKDYSDIHKLFYDFSISEIISNDNSENMLSRTIEPFFMLHLSIEKMSSIQDCLDFYIQGEILENENAWFNDKTQKKENVKKQIKFWGFPQILVLVLKRTNPFTQKKDNHLINYPVNEKLDLSSYAVGYDKNNQKFELYAVCNHVGNAQYGHYTCFVKKNNSWFFCNDDQVSESDIAHIMTPHAYCLFYRKVM
jgi:ubiquitin C-terminal hydrolase